MIQCYCDMMHSRGSYPYFRHIPQYLDIKYTVLMFIFLQTENIVVAET